MRALIIAALLLATPAAARDLQVPPDKGWKHNASGVVLRRSLIDLPRTALTDSGTRELDVIAQFENGGRETALTVYVFHAADPNAALWFDRARTTLERRDQWGGVRPLAEPVAFTPPGATTASGLREAFATGKGPYKSTALAVAPVGEWLVAVRLSSMTLDAATLDAKLSEAIAAIGWPAAPAAPVATPVPVCPTSLAFKKAKLRKPDMAQALMGGLIGAASAMKATKTEGPPKPLCRDGEPTEIYGVYRAADVTDGYTLAVGDSGRTVSVYKSFNLEKESAGTWAVALHDLDGSVATYPEFDALPRPQQVVDVIMKTGPISRTSGNGRDINISTGVK